MAVGVKARACFAQEFIHEAVEGGMGEPMEGARGLGKEAARMLVLPLGAAFEERDAALDAELDRLVIAGLEVQPRHVLAAAPVAPVEGVAPEEVEGRGDRLAVPP